MTHPPDILFEDVHVLVVNKPAGLLTQGWAGGEPSLESQIRTYLGLSAGSTCYLGTVHRLDRPVSGVILWAKTPKAARRLAFQFASRTAEKMYVALVASRAVLSVSEWSDNLREKTASGRVEITGEGLVGTRRAITHVCPLSLNPERDEIRALRLRPVTGRKHQLRVQASARGCPILGDVAYGSRDPFPDGIALHARSLKFEHPITRTSIRIEAPYPEIWCREGLVPLES